MYIYIFREMRRTLAIYILPAFLAKFTFEVAGRTGICEYTGWEKVPGMKPEYTVSKKTLYAGVDSQGIVVACFDRCLLTENCNAFVIDFETSGCYSVETDSKDFVPEPRFTFYHKICVKVPPSCATRLWQFERTLGAVLTESEDEETAQPRTVARSECYRRCIAAGSNCRAALFRTSRDLAIGDSRGRCRLSSISRSTRPQSYGASMYRDEYLENQCHNLSSSDFCSYAEYRNETPPYSDLKVSGLETRECEERCDSGNDGFACKSYTIERSNVSGKSTCYLHSDDTIGAGVGSLAKKPNVVYREREPCLDLNARCSETSMSVRLGTEEPFNGRIYASGYSDECGVQGNARRETTLVLPLPGEEDVASYIASDIACGVTPAYAVYKDNRTRTAVWVTVVVQYNPIVQRLGDRSVRVGCTLDDPLVPAPLNVTVNAGFGFADVAAGIPPVTFTVFDATAVPTVTMRILDRENKDVVVTNLGDELTLKIEIAPSDGPYDIFAGHLVASSQSGASSILLLDERGCPGDVRIFPPLTRDIADDKSLISTFSAFKFPDDTRVRFDVVVKFCLTECEPVKCGNGLIGYGKKRRSMTDDSDEAKNVSEWRRTRTDELSLRRSIVVEDPTISTALHSRDDGGKAAANTILIAGQKAASEGAVCADAALVLGLLLFWLCVQIVLTFGCVFLVGRYRRHARRAEEDRAEILARHLRGVRGPHFEIARRRGGVRWADDNDESSIG